MGHTPWVALPSALLAHQDVTRSRVQQAACQQLPVGQGSTLFPLLRRLQTPCVGTVARELPHREKGPSALYATEMANIQMKTEHRRARPPAQVTNQTPTAPVSTCVLREPFQWEGLTPVSRALRVRRATQAPPAARHAPPALLGGTRSPTARLPPRPSAGTALRVKRRWEERRLRAPSVTALGNTQTRP